MKRKFWKNIFSLLMCSLLAIAAAVPCFAQENNQVVTTYTEDLGNGITVVTTIAKTVTRSATSTTKTKDYYSGGQKIGRAALYGSFSYNGSTAQATGADGTGTGINGWSYGGQSTWTSGNSAHLSATLSKGSVSVPVSISLSCDAHGNVS